MDGSFLRLLIWTFIKADQPWDVGQKHEVVESIHNQWVEICALSGFQIFVFIAKRMVLHFVIPKL